MFRRAGGRRRMFRSVREFAAAGAVVHVEDLASVLECGPDYVYKLIDAGTLRAVRVGRQYRIETREAVRLLGDLGFDVPAEVRARVLD